MDPQNQPQRHLEAVGRGDPGRPLDLLRTNLHLSIAGPHAHVPICQALTPLSPVPSPLQVPLSVSLK